MERYAGVVIMKILLRLFPVKLILAGIAAGALCFSGCSRKPKEEKDFPSAFEDVERATPPPMEAHPRGGTLQFQMGGQKVRLRYSEAMLQIRGTNQPDAIEIRGEGLILYALLDENGDGVADGADRLAVSPEGDLEGESVVEAVFLVQGVDVMPDTLFFPPQGDQLDVTGGRIVVSGYKNGYGSPDDAWEAELEMTFTDANGAAVSTSGRIEGGILLAL